MIILGFDPGRDKCGIAVVSADNNILYHQVVNSESAIALLDKLIGQYHPEILVMGNQTTSSYWRKRLEKELTQVIKIELVNEKNSTQEAKQKYWQIYPPQGLTKLIPLSLRIPPQPVDDIVAIILVERYVRSVKVK